MFRNGGSGRWLFRKAVGFGWRREEYDQSVYLRRASRGIYLRGAGSDVDAQAAQGFRNDLSGVRKKLGILSVRQPCCNPVRQHFKQLHSAGTIPGFRLLSL